MKVASNKIIHLRDYYFEELATEMEVSEIDTHFALAMEHYLGIRRNELNLKLNQNINQSDLIQIYDCCKMIKQQIPLQYVLGETNFYGLKLKVDANVLIPRPETEELVELIIKEDYKPNSILDIGTGSGCISIAFKKNRPNCNISACDISRNALDLAKQNAILNSTPIDFFECNILDEYNSIFTLNLKYDLIVSNPPYILASEKSNMQSQVIDHEPHLALFVEEDDAIIFYKKIINLCKMHLNKNGRLFFELNPRTSDEVFQAAVMTKCFSKIELIKDMSGKVRFLKATKV